MLLILILAAVLVVGVLVMVIARRGRSGPSAGATDSGYPAHSPGTATQTRHSAAGTTTNLASAKALNEKGTAVLHRREIRLRSGSGPVAATTGANGGRLPTALTAALHDPNQAPAAVLVMLVGPESGLGSIRSALAQVPSLVRTNPDLPKHLEALLPWWRQVDAERARLPILDGARMALRQIPAPARHDLLLLANHLAGADGLTIDEVVVLALLRGILDSAASDTHMARPVRWQTWDGLGPAAAIVLEAVARGTGTQGGAYASYATAMQWLLIPKIPEQPVGPISGSDLMQALDQLAQAAPALRRTLVEAAAHAVAVDGVIQPQEIERLRLLALTLDCPMPDLRG